MSLLGVVDYGVGNMQSVANALNKIDVPWKVVTEPSHLRVHRRLLLPGVGAFGPAMELLGKTGLREGILLAAESGVPVLGICLGMQLLGLSSAENPSTSGLGLLDARTVALENGQNFTNTGFRKVAISETAGNAEFPTFDRDYYFNHGYHLVPGNSDVVVGSIDWYGSRVVAAVSHETVSGVQFHPEKSQGQGLSLLYQFAVSGELRL